MDFISLDNTLAATLLAPLISFLEAADAANMTWASACESGFTFNFLKKLLVIAPSDDREAIVGFLVHKIDQLTDQVMSIGSGGGGSPSSPLFLQELLHALAASTSVNWTAYQEVISNVTKKIMQ